MRKIAIIFTFLLVVTSVAASNDSIMSGVISSRTNPEGIPKKSWFKRTVENLADVFTPQLDTTYIEENPYNFQVMLQGNMTDDDFTVSSSDAFSMHLAPQKHYSITPFAGWRWLFFGYTFNINLLEIEKDKVNINTTIYTPAVFADVVIRNLGADYRLRSLNIDGKDMHAADGMEVEGLDIDVLSANVQYALNNKRYSLQAAFNQNNKQLRSAGSLVFGLGYNCTKVSLNWDEFQKSLDKVTNNNPEYKLHSDRELYNNVTYKSIPFSVGYGYNWVFAKNWLAAGLVSGSLSYMWQKGEAKEDPTLGDVFHDFDVSNFTIGGNARVGLIWTNTKWFAGGSYVFHTYHFHDRGIQMNNFFQKAYLYVGFNFWPRKR